MEEGSNPEIERHVLVFGDSHSIFFRESPYYVGRLDLNKPLPFRFRTQVIQGASVAGFRQGESRLSVKDEILAGVSSAERIVCAFGQVDLELGYYYRLSVKRESIDTDSYVEWLLSVYRKFLESLPSGEVHIVLKGVNLTALRPRAFMARYVSRIVVEQAMEPRIRDRIVAPFLLPEDEQNLMHLSFNRGVAEIARSLGFGYFDVVEETRSVDGLRDVPVLDSRHVSSAFDHHLADTAYIRKVYYEGAVRAFLELSQM